MARVLDVLEYLFDYDDFVWVCLKQLVGWAEQDWFKLLSEGLLLQVASLEQVDQRLEHLSVNSTFRLLMLPERLLNGYTQASLTVEVGAVHLRVCL